MKIMKAALAALLVCGCARPDPAAVSGRMVAMFEKMERTGSYTMHVKKTEDDARYEIFYETWKDKDEVYSYIDSPWHRIVSRFDTSHAKTVSGKWSFDVFEVQSIDQTEQARFRYLGNVYEYVRFPFLFDAESNVDGLKDFFDWTIEKDNTYRATLQKKRIPELNEGIVQEWRDLGMDLKTLDLKQCDYTFHLNGQGELVKADIVQDYTFSKKNGEPESHRVETEIGFAYDQGNEKVREQTKALLDQELQIGDNAPWDGEGIPQPAGEFPLPKNS